MHDGPLTSATTDHAVIDKLADSRWAALSLSFYLTIVCTGCGSGQPNDPFEPPPDTAVMRVISSSSGSALDENGYLVSLDDTETKSIGVNDTVFFIRDSSAPHEVVLSDVAVNCGIQSMNPQSVNAILGDTTAVTFEVWCVDTSGQLVFYSTRSGDQDIYLVNVDGSQLTRLTSTPAVEWEPDFSPDGSQIVFAANLDGSQLDIYVMNADGTSLRRLTSHPRDDRKPAWSPDGELVVFRSFRDLDDEIYKINVDGSGLSRLTSIDGPEDDPEFSPDGSLIAFTSRRNSNAINIFTMTPDGNNVTQLTFIDTASSWAPSWSPDGTQIVFQSHRDDPLQAELYLMNADGSNVRRLTNNDVADEAPAWSPDGLRIAYSSSTSDSQFDLIVMEVDGSFSFQLTAASGVNYGARWKPSNLP